MVQRVLIIDDEVALARNIKDYLEADGFEVDPENPDRIRVTAGRLAETSLVALGAYPGAGPHARHEDSRGAGCLSAGSDQVSGPGDQRA